MPDRSVPIPRRTDDREPSLALVFGILGAVVGAVLLLFAAAILLTYYFGIILF